MGNWFEDNPTRAIILHTIVVAGATWGFSKFVLEENRMNLCRAELENEQSQVSALQTKYAMLEGELKAAMEENRGYLEWLERMPNALPAIQPRIRELESKNAALESRLVSQPDTGGFGRWDQQDEVLEGKAYLDPRTGAIVAVTRVTADRRADLNITLPGQRQQLHAGVAPGSTWDFTAGNRRFRLLVTEVNFLGSYVQVQTLPVEGGSS